MSHAAVPCLVFMALWATSPPAAAQNIVDLCRTDVEIGSGRNLTTALARGGRITFKCPPATVITMTTGHTVRPGTVIDGASTITLDARGTAMTMFAVASGSFTIERLTIRNAAVRRSFVGRISAAVVESAGNVTLTDVIIQNSSYAVVIRGGGRIVGCRFIGNASTALTIQSDASVADSTFIANGTGLSMKRGLVRNSRFAQHSTGAIVVYYPTGRVAITGVTFDANVGEGALRLSQRALGNATAVVVVKRSTFANNATPDRGGAINVYDTTTMSRVALRRAQLRRYGPVRFELAYNRFIGNRGFSGGAINADLRNTTGLIVKGGIFIDNRAVESGGAMEWQGRSILIAHSLFKANQAGAGGAVHAVNREAGATWTIANSLIAENVVPGGGIIDAGPVALFNVTVANNIGVGIVSNSSLAQRPAIANSIFSGNTAGNCQGVASGAFTGGNLQFGASDCPGAASGNPYLDTLYVPSDGSAALVMGDVAICRAAPVSRNDIVFQSRATGAQCAIGAFERPPVQHVPVEKGHAPAKVPR